MWKFLNKNKIDVKQAYWLDYNNHFSFSSDYPLKRIDGLGGKTLVYNQFLNIENVKRDQTKDGVTLTDNRDGTYTLSGTATATGGFSVIGSNGYISNTHKYLLIGCPSGGGEGKYQLNDGYSLGFNDNGSGAIAKGSSSGNFVVYVRYWKDQVYDNVIFKPKLYDLSLMFGIRNELTDISKIMSLINNQDEYNLGQIATTSIDRITYKSLRPLVSENFDLTPKTLYGINDVIKDEYNFINGKITRKFGIVDLGTLNWNPQTSYTAYSAGIQSLAKKPSSYAITANAMCSRYILTSEENINTTAKSIAISSGGVILINDSSLGTTREEIKNNLSGIYLVYELANPIYEDAPLDKPIIFETTASNYNINLFSENIIGNIAYVDCSNGSKKFDNDNFNLGTTHAVKSQMWTTANMLKKQDDFTNIGAIQDNFLYIGDNTYSSTQNKVTNFNFGLIETSYYVIMSYEGDLNVNEEGSLIIANTEKGDIECELVEHDNIRKVMTFVFPSTEQVILNYFYFRDLGSIKKVINLVMLDKYDDIDDPSSSMYVLMPYLVRLANDKVAYIDIAKSYVYSITSNIDCPQLLDKSDLFSCDSVCINNNNTYYNFNSTEGLNLEKRNYINNNVQEKIYFNNQDTYFLVIKTSEGGFETNTQCTSATIGTRGYVLKLINQYFSEDNKTFILKFNAKNVNANCITATFNQGQDGENAKILQAFIINGTASGVDYKSCQELYNDIKDNINDLSQGIAKLINY